MRKGHKKTPKNKLDLKIEVVFKKIKKAD